MRTQAKEALNGLVTFHVSYRNPESDLAGTAFLDAVPEYKTWGDNLVRVKNSLYATAWRLPLTTSITFADGELPPELEDFREFWQFAQAHKDDYRAVWERARKISYEIMDAWWSAEYKDLRLAAPDILQKTRAEVNATGDPE